MRGVKVVAALIKVAVLAFSIFVLGAAVVAWYWLDLPVFPPDPAIGVGLIPERVTPGNESAIVFVHGMGGHPVKTWKHPEVSHSWFDLMKGDRSFAGFDIYTMTYPTLGKRLELPELEEALGPMLPSGLGGYRHTYIVAYSFGGILMQRLLTRLYNSAEPASNALARTVRLVLFLATPGKSDARAYIAVWVTRNTLWEYLASRPYMFDVRYWWERDFLRRDPAVAACFAETQRLMGWLSIVGAESASMPCVRQYLPIPGDHLAITAPRSCRDESYYRVALEILSRAREVRGLKGPFPAGPDCPSPAVQTGTISTPLVGRPWIGDALAQPADRDFEALRIALHQQKDPQRLPELLKYLRRDSPLAAAAAKLVAGLFQQRDPKLTGFYRDLARILQQASLSYDSPFRGADFTSADLSALDLSHVSFAGANLRGVSFLGANLEKANFSRACLRGAKLVSQKQWAWMDLARFDGADLSGAEVQWEERRLLEGREVVVGLSRASSLKEAILTPQDPTADTLARSRGALVTSNPSRSPCR